MQVQAIEYEEVPEGTGKGEWKRRQEGGVDLWVTGRGEAVLHLQHRDDMGAGWGAERAVEMRTDRAVWLEPGLRGERWWVWHMTWWADQGERVPVRKEGNCWEEERMLVGCAHTSQGQRWPQHPLRKGKGGRRRCMRSGRR